MCAGHGVVLYSSPGTGQTIVTSQSPAMPVPKDVEEAETVNADIVEREVEATVDQRSPECKLEEGMA